MSTFSQRNFAGGELSPANYGRSDVLKYVTGARSLYNVTILRSGGVTNRAGTQFISEVYDSTKETRLIPFIIDDDTAYVIELSNLKARIFYQGSPVLNFITNPRTAAGTLTGVTQNNPGLFTKAAHGLINGTLIYIEGVVGMTELNGNTYTVYDAQLNTFRLIDSNGDNLDTSSFGAYVSGGSFFIGLETLTTVFTEAELFDVHHSQSGSTMVLTHRDHRPQELTQNFHENWVITDLPSESQVTAPANLQTTGGTGAGPTTYQATVVSESGEESVFATDTIAASPTAGNPITVTWDTITGAFVRVFRDYGYIGDGGTSLIDAGQTTDYFRTRIVDLLGVRQFATSCYYQQRLFLGAEHTPLLENFARFISSRVGSLRNFNVFNLSTDDQPVDFTLAQALRSSEIRHLVNFEKLVIFTANGVHVANGDEGGALTRTTANIGQIPAPGASLSPQPLIANQGLLYVQSGSSIIRDLAGKVQTTGYQGNDLTVFSSHLFDGHTIVGWAFQEFPHPVIWVVRDDGILLCLSYLKEQEIWGWTKCELASDGLVESVCCVPEGNDEVVYFVVKRGTDRFIEKLTNRYFTDVKDAVFLDSSLSFDGRNTTTSHTMTLSASGWTYNDEITITSSTAFFSSAEIGNEIHLTGSDGTIIRLRLTSYTSTTVMKGQPNKTIPASMRATAISNWARAVDEISGLDHLEGESVGVFADGFVVANPINPKFTNTITVTGGVATLPACYTVIHAGLPYYSDIETLDIDIADRESMVGKKMQIGKVHVRLEKSRGFFAGNRSTASDATLLTGLYESKIRNAEGYDSPISLRDEVVELLIRSEWNSNGRVLVRNVDPIPFTVLSIHPEGHVPVRK